MCAGLLDPRWREQQQKSVEDKKQQEEVYAAGTQIGSNLKYLADYRTDIFGQEETVIGRKVCVCVRACMRVCMCIECSYPSCGMATSKPQSLCIQSHVHFMLGPDSVACRL